MKKMIIFLCWILPAISMAQEKKIVINGTMDNKIPTTIHVLFYNSHTKAKTFDSVVVKDGRFSLTVPPSSLLVQTVQMVASHNGQALTQKDAADSKVFLVDNSGANIYIKDFIKTAVITGDKIEEEKEKYIKYTYLAEADSAKLGWAINGLHPFGLGIQGKAPDTSNAEAYAEYRKNMFLKANMDRLTQLKLNKERQYIRDYPDSYFCFSALEDLIRYGDLDQVQPIINGLSARLRSSTDAEDILAMLEKAKDDKLHPEKVAARHAAPPKRLGTGTMAPDFTEFDQNGKAIKLSDFKGKYILLDFWASWCVPCRAESPNVIKAYNLYKDKNFTVVSVAMEEKGHMAAWLAAIKKDGLTWTQLADIAKADNPAVKAFGVSEIPMNFLIDPSGKIIASDLRGEALQSKLAEVFSN